MGVIEYEGSNARWVERRVNDRIIAELTVVATDWVITSYSRPIEPDKTVQENQEYR